MRENGVSEHSLDIRFVGSMCIVLNHMAGHWLWYHSLMGYPRHRDPHTTHGPPNSDVHRGVSLCIHFLWIYKRDKESKRRKWTLSENPDVLITCTPLPTTSLFHHTLTCENCLSPSNLSVSRSLATCPTMLPDTHGHQTVNMPPHQALET